MSHGELYYTGSAGQADEKNRARDFRVHENPFTFAQIGQRLQLVIVYSSVVIRKACFCLSIQNTQFYNCRWQAGGRQHITGNLPWITGGWNR